MDEGLELQTESEESITQGSARVMAQHLDALRRQRDDIELQIQETQIALVDAMRRLKLKDFHFNGRAYTLVSPQRVKVNAAVLRTLIPADVYADLVKESVTSTALEQAINAGRITAEQVMDACEVSQASSHVRATDFIEEAQ